MTDVDQVLQEFAERWRSGDRPDPGEYADRFEGLDQKEFLARVDRFLARAPRRRWDPEAYAGSLAERVVEQLEPSLSGVSGVWPSVLPQLRDRAKITRRALVDRLAERLGVSARRDKVYVYYHQMEQGALPAAGVSQRVLDTLGELLHTSGEQLRRAGEAVSPAGPEARDAQVFARAASEPAAPAAAGPPSKDDRPDEAWDEVDELFRSG